MLTDVPKKKRPPIKKRRVDLRYFYQKSEKSYKKVRYFPMEEEEIVATTPKKKPVTKAKEVTKKPPIRNGLSTKERLTKARKETAEKEKKKQQTKKHSFEIRRRPEN